MPEALCDVASSAGSLLLEVESWAPHFESSPPNLDATWKPNKAKKRDPANEVYTH